MMEKDHVSTITAVFIRLLFTSNQERFRGIFHPLWNLFTSLFLKRWAMKFKQNNDSSFNYDLSLSQRDFSAFLSYICLNVIQIYPSFPYFMEKFIFQQYNNQEQ